MNRLLLAALAVLSAPVNSASLSPQSILTPTKLIASIESEKGRTVTVSGYFTYSMDTRALWESRSAYVDARDESKGDSTDYWTKCITIYPRGRIARRFSGQWVQITGTATVIDKDDIRSLWTCNQVALMHAEVTGGR